MEESDDNEKLIQWKFYGRTKQGYRQGRIIRKEESELLGRLGATFYRIAGNLLFIVWAIIVIQSLRVFFWDLSIRFGGKEENIVRLLC